MRWVYHPGRKDAAFLLTVEKLGRLIFIHLQCWEVLPFCRFQRQRCIKIRVLSAQDFYTPLALQTAKGQHLPALEVYKNQSPKASCLQWSFLLTVDSFSFFTCSWSFFPYIFSFPTYSWSFFAYSGKLRLIRALRDCKQKSFNCKQKSFPPKSFAHKTFSGRTGQQSSRPGIRTKRFMFLGFRG